MEKNKEIFIQEVEKIENQLSPEAKAYFDYMRDPGPTQKEPRPALTENGKNILSFMINNKEQYNNVFKSKDIAEGLFISTKSVSASMQKLVKEEFCTRIGGNPVCYSITEKGEKVDF